MAVADKSKKNSLTIRLAESAVFLRTQPGRRCNQETRPSVLRGLLTLELVNPTKISSIELELQAKSETAWTEGFGARRIEISEEQKLFNASVIYFSADKSQSRRGISLGPGVQASTDVDAVGTDDWEHTQSHTPHDHIPSSRTQLRRGSFDSMSFPSIANVNEGSEQLDLGPSPPYSPLGALATEMPLTSSRSSSFDPCSRESTSTLSSQIRTELPEDNVSSITSDSASSSSIHRRSPSCSRRHQTDISNGPEPNSQRHRASTPLGSLTSSRERRGRSGSRFSFSSVSNAFIGVVRSGSPLHTKTPGIDKVKSSCSRGRPLEKGKGKAVDCVNDQPEGPLCSKERSAFFRFGDKLKSENDDKKESGINWKEFKKGVYTYPISISIPGHSPPTLQCDYGSVTWRLKATVHRPGAFKPKLTASREVVVIASPTEDDVEDNESIVVERLWDQQLQYLISIAGRSFYIGGTVPISFTMMPLTKIKVHKISVCIEERVDYYTQMKRIARSDPINRIQLLSIGGEAKGDDPILPIQSDDIDAFKKSPLFGLVTPGDDVSAMAASLMGPGPWTFHQDLKLPSSCRVVHTTNKNKRCNIIIAHTLKCIMRVERDDPQIDLKTGKRKLYDIVVQTPIHILSCRCNPDWSSLPHYTETFADPSVDTPTCPCEAKRNASNTKTKSGLQRPSIHPFVGSEGSAMNSNQASPVCVRSWCPSMFQANSQFERLVSGQESESGEAPPAYSTPFGINMVMAN